MAKAPYQPPKQSLWGQTFDTLFLLALVMAALFVPLHLGLAGGGKTTVELKDTTWQGMGQNPTMQAQWEKLGFTPGPKTEENATSAAELIATRFDYTIEPVELGLTALVVIAYFYIVFHWSRKEYRDVIDEKFNNK
jgi:di/tricarboxylate transporter